MSGRMEERKSNTRGRFAPRFHLYPGQGWMNDPCGCSRFRDEYHIFFQYHETPRPEGPGKWRHMAGKDLLRWEDRGIALEPDREYEQNGCWTGSAVEREGRHLLYYSANLDGRLPQQQPALAVSRDGRRYEKQGRGTLIRECSPDGHEEMRDPKVFWRDGIYYMLQGASREGRGEIVGYSSEDGLRWKYRGIFYSPERWNGSMLECPDFFRLDGKDCLIFSPVDWPGHANVLWTGTADFERFVFRPERMYELDEGSDFYAAQALPHRNGGMLAVGWLGSWGKPHPECAEGWGGMLSIPRRLSLSGPGGRLRQTPAEELCLLRGKEFRHRVLLGEEPYVLPGELGCSMELYLELDCGEEPPGTLQITLGTAKRAAVRFSADAARGILRIDKREASLGDNSLRMRALAPGRPGAAVKLRLFWDNSACELFWGEGETVVSERIYLDQGAPEAAVSLERGSRTAQLCAWPLRGLS